MQEKVLSFSKSFISLGGGLSEVSKSTTEWGYVGPIRCRIKCSALYLLILNTSEYFCGVYRNLFSLASQLLTW